MNREQARRLLDRTAKLENTEDKKNADSIVNVASEANIQLLRQLTQEGETRLSASLTIPLRQTECRAGRSFPGL